MEKPNVFESVMPCSGEYSWKRDLRLNAWLLVATVFYLAQLFLLRRNPEWTPLVRGMVALSPLIPALLYVRSWVRFIRGLDELQRRVQLEAHVFAAWGTIVVGVVVSTLNQHGVVNILPHGLSFGSVLMIQFPLWLIGIGMANRRYK
jgi:hypothetical protein